MSPAYRDKIPNHKTEYPDDPLLQLLALRPNHLIAQTRHPETPLNGAIHRLELILSTRINEPQQALHNTSRRAIALEIDQRHALPGARNLARLLRVVGQVVDVHGDDGDAALVAVDGLHLLAQVVEVLDGRHQRLELGEGFLLGGGHELPGFGQAGAVDGGEGDGQLEHGGVVVGSPGVHGDVDVFHDAHGALFQALGEDDFGQGPFDDDVETGGDELDAGCVLGSEEFDPILG